MEPSLMASDNQTAWRPLGMLVKQPPHSPRGFGFCVARMGTGAASSEGSGTEPGVAPLARAQSIRRLPNCGSGLGLCLPDGGHPLPGWPGRRCRRLPGDNAPTLWHGCDRPGPAAAAAGRDYALAPGAALRAPGGDQDTRGGSLVVDGYSLLPAMFALHREGRRPGGLAALRLLPPDTWTPSTGDS